VCAVFGDELQQAGAEFTVTVYCGPDDFSRDWILFHCFVFSLLLW